MPRYFSIADLNKSNQEYLRSIAASFASLVFGPLLLYPVDHAILKAIQPRVHGKGGMMSLFSFMNFVMLITLFLFTCMFFKFISNCIRKRPDSSGLGLNAALDLSRILSMVVVSIATARVVAFPPKTLKSWVGVIALTILGLFIVWGLADNINKHVNAQDVKKYNRN